MRAGDAKVAVGGLMRCCLATLANHAEDEVHDGAELPCDYESGAEPVMVLRDGVWRWVGPADGR